MRFLIDQNLGRKFTNLLNQAGYDGIFIKDLLLKASDEDVLSLAEHESRIVVTNDKDFGKLIFKLSRPSAGVILLRISSTDPETRFAIIKGALHKAEGKFIVVKDGQIRIRGLKRM